MDMTPASKKSDGRTWKACISCRRKKIKCDGLDPCHTCQSRDQLCEYPETHDNAAASRRYAISFEQRCQHMDELCSRLEGLAQTLSECIQGPDGSTLSSGDSTQLALPARHSVTNIPDRVASRTDPSQKNEVSRINLESDIGFPNQYHQDNTSSPYQAHTHPVGHMVADSYGRLRYVGGAGNNTVIEAVQNLSPVINSTGFNNQSSIRNSDVELPFFTRGQRWPDLPYLPKAKDLPRPPRYISDLLVGIYFDQLHYSFPILYKPQFMQQYQNMKNAKPNDEIDKAFLSVFFAVCACASGLLPQAQGSSTLVGIEYYQKSLLLYFASSGEVFLEQVQCLGLLAFCSASWNVLAQSWRFAGQAVRIAQDLGLHVSSLREPNEEPYNLCEYRDAQIARCVWWSVFGIDCISSICLGRPMAADVAHCCCDLPTNISNEDLEQGCGPNDQSNSSLSSPMAGFIAFTQLCKIAAEVHRFHSSFRLRSRNASNTSMKEALPTVNILIRELDNWLQELPDEIKFSANSLQRGPNLTMSVVVFILHSATIMNLYRPLVGLEFRGNIPENSTFSDPSAECISAARSCIQAAELIHDSLPPSHYLAICVQYLTISGILMLDMARDNETPDQTSEMRKSILILSEIEKIWPGASRNRSILESLLRNPRGRSGNAQFPSLPLFEGLLWEQFPESDTLVEELLRGDFTSP